MLKEFRTLLPFVRKYRRMYIFGIFWLLVTSGGQLLIPQFIRIAIDMIAEGAVDLSSVAELMGWLLLTAVLIAAGRFGWRYYIHGASRRIEKELRDKLFNHLLSLSGSFYNRTRIGDLMARATNDMNAIRMASGMALVALTDGLLMSAAILTIIFIQNPALALIVILPLPLITFLVLFLGKLVGQLFRSVQEGFSTLSEQAQESLAGIRVIKSFVKEDYFANRFRDANDEYQTRNMRLIRIWGMFFPLVTFLSGLTSLLLLRFGGVAVVVGEISAGDFVQTLSYLEMMIWPMLGMGFTVNLLQRGGASLSRVNQILQEEPDITSPINGIRTPIHGSIEIRNLSYQYSDTEDEALRNIDLTVPAGSILGILGRTGSGKSTLIKLLPRLIDPPRGTIFLDGRDIHDYDLSWLRLQFAIVAQDNFLFSQTIRDNIGFGMSVSDDERILHVADVSTISRDIENFPAGWDTQVGERGITLSGGQKQRVSISRALATDHGILIFDDALSAVDTETEERILDQLLKERAGKTSIIISHRVSTLKTADHIAVIEHGRIVQHGTHTELLEDEDGFYAEIAALQRLESAGDLKS
ncbi:MAG: ABC transporter ATP-binding protein [Spirochaetaceae bacterium]|nr:MAG: ABC transporter ATP-binding protein [Spirochaetaceae bacterium]